MSGLLAVPRTLVLHRSAATGARRLAVCAVPLTRTAAAARGTCWCQPSADLVAGRAFIAGRCSRDVLDATLVNAHLEAEAAVDVTRDAAGR
ncbi:hypothetical protein BSZ07_37825 [Streptomyces sp. M1013]|nr:hypothetical protein BSZ07_37825 [Streptomyces sp. M1013]